MPAVCLALGDRGVPPSSHAVATPLSAPWMGSELTSPCSWEARVGPGAVNLGREGPLCWLSPWSFLETCRLLLPSDIQVVAGQLEGKENLNDVQREGML